MTVTSRLVSNNDGVVDGMCVIFSLQLLDDKTVRIAKGERFDVKLCLSRISMKVMDGDLDTYGIYAYRLPSKAAQNLPGCGSDSYAILAVAPSLLRRRSLLLDAPRTRRKPPRHVL